MKNTKWRLNGSTAHGYPDRGRLVLAERAEVLEHRAAEQQRVCVGGAGPLLARRARRPACSLVALLIPAVFFRP